MHKDTAAVTTSFHVSRWDDDAVRFVLRRERVTDSEMRGRNITIGPQTFEQHRVRPYSVTHDFNCNNILQAGWVALLGSIAGTSIVNKFSGTNGRIGIGTSTTSVSYSQTALVGDTGGSSTTSYYKLVSGAPVIATASTPPTLTFTSTFGTGVANFAWNEFGTDNYTADGVTTTGLSNVIFINRGISPQGTKQNTQIWTATEVLTFGVPTAAGTVG